MQNLTLDVVQQSRISFLLVFAFFLASCGGGGGGGGSVAVASTSQNRAPIANAGVDRSLDISPNAVTLDGAASSDADGDALAFRWSVASQPSGQNVSIANSSSSAASFSSSAPGTYTFALTVSDPTGASSSDSVEITLVNQAPTISLANYEEKGFVGKLHILDASGSSDPNGHVLTYSWEVLTAPSDSNLAGKLFSNALPDVKFDTPGDFTAKVTVSDGYTTRTDTLNVISIARIELLEIVGGFKDLEFDPVNERVVSVFEDEITSIEKGGEQTKLALPLPGTAVSIAPSGDYAVVAHNAFISHIDLNTNSILATHPVAADIGDIVLDDNGFAHGFPETGQWGSVYTMNMATGEVQISTGGSTRQRTKAKLHPSGNKIYAANNGLFPSDIERYDIESDSLRLRYDSPYHGDYPFCGDIWMGPSGDTMLTRCGVVVRGSNVTSSDMTFVMQLPASQQYISHASSSDYSRLWYVLAGADGSDQVEVFDIDTGSLIETISLPGTADGAAQQWYGKFVFASGTSDLFYVLAVDDINNPQKFALVKQYESPSTVSDFAPTAVAHRYKTSRVSELVTMDASASTDPDGKALTYDWMLTSEPQGSAITPSGMTNSIASFTPSVPGVYEFTLRVDNGERQSNIKRVSVSVFGNGESLVHRLEGGIADVEFSKSLNALVYLSDTTQVLFILDLNDLTTVSVPLGRMAYQVAISPDGGFAAVSHAGMVSLIDLNTASVIDSQEYSADWGDIVLDHNNRAHVIPNRDQWVDFHTLDFETNTTSKSYGPRAGTQMRMHPIEGWVYGADRGLSPSDFEKWDVSAATSVSVSDSPYHGDYPISGNIWISEDGERLMVAGGKFFRSSSDSSEDMLYAGALSDSINVLWADHSEELNEWAVISPAPGFSGQVTFYTDDFYNRSRIMAAAVIPTANGDVNSAPEKVFNSSNGGELYVLLKGTGLSDSYAVQIEN